MDNLCNATIADKHSLRSCRVEQHNITTRDSLRKDTPKLNRLVTSQ